ncbi:SDR family oxidoreductase [Larsenimonas rhizosphaerae]|uniref:SDR family oxidoreductase n=1 Tax=Larsenimonas rhizosphaerae TaxID=2944682 RepID=UPI0020342449|nr:SDR family oxidoreductase [Larsenimonas rhizosphaerae]MCM2131978.1 SDR family oxidoreductase [Larsenimonas rhizosphaerae]
MKIAILTGASGGIGRACATRLADDGWQLMLVGRRTTPLAELASRLPGHHEVVAGNLNEASTRTAIVERLTALDWAPSLLINNAGVNQLSFLGDCDEAEIEAQLTTNLIAPILLTRALLPLMARPGQVVNIGSALGAIGHPGYSIYGASKAGMRLFSQALDRELGDDNIRVGWLAPRATHTTMNNEAAQAMQKALGTRVDAPDVVAQALMTHLKRPCTERFIGQPEGFFARLNSFLPDLVRGSLIKQLPIIRRFTHPA